MNSLFSFASARVIALLAAFGWVTLFCIPACPAQTEWNVSNGSWFGPSNWTLGVPGAANNAVIGNNGSAANISGSASAAMLQIGTTSGSGTLFMDGSGPASVSLNVNLLDIGSTGSGRGSVTVAGGSTLNSATTISIGFSSSADPSQLALYTGGKANSNSHFYIASNGGLLVDGTGSTLTIDDAKFFEVGFANISMGTGATVEVLNGGVIHSGLLNIATISGVAGTVTVNGAGSELDVNSDFFRVGYSGSGVLTVEDGGLIQAKGGTGSIVLAHNAGSSGVLNIGSGGAAGTISASSIQGNNVGAVLNFNHNESAYTFAVPITGMTEVNFEGSGTTLLTGASTYTGATQINAGKLIVNGSLGNTDVTVASGAVLGGSGSLGGSVIVQGGAQLSPGNSPGILNIGGDLTLNSGSTTTMEINGLTPGTQHDQIVVAGTATLDGTLNLQFGYAPLGGDSFTLIQAGNFNLAGDAAQGFSSINSNLGAALSVVVGATTYDITVLQSAFSNFAQTPNQAAVAAALDSEVTAPGLADAVSALNMLGADELPQAFDLIAPEELAAMAETGLANARAVHDLLSNRFREIRSGQSFSVDGLAFSGDFSSSSVDARSLLASAGSGGTPGLRLSSPQPRLDPNLGLFVSGQGVLGDYDGDGNAEGFDFSTGSFLTGLDYRLGSRSSVGLYGGYQGTDADLTNGGNIQSDSAKFGLYATHDFGQGTWLNASVGGGVHAYETERAAFGGQANGSTDGFEVSSQAGVGHDFKAGRNREWTFGPEVDVSYTHLAIDSFTEHGSLAPLSIESQEADSLRTTVAGRVSYDWKCHSGQWLLRPMLNLGWRHEFMDTNQSISSRFANGTGTVFRVQDTDRARDSLVSGAGIGFFFNEQTALNLGYASEFNADYLVHQVNASVRWSF